VATPDDLSSTFGRWLLLTLSGSQSESAVVRQKVLAEWPEESLEQFTVLWFVFIMLVAKGFGNSESPRIRLFAESVWSHLMQNDVAEPSDISAIIRVALNDRAATLPDVPPNVMATICSACCRALVIDEGLSSDDLVVLIAEAENAAISEGVILR
jgi:hypothetical protein